MTQARRRADQNLRDTVRRKPARRTALADSQLDQQTLARRRKSRRRQRLSLRLAQNSLISSTRGLLESRQGRSTKNRGITRRPYTLPFRQGPDRHGACKYASRRNFLAWLPNGKLA